MNIKHTSWWVGGLLLLAGQALLADEIQTTEFAITATPGALETSPTVGADALGEIVVYSSREFLPSGLGFGIITYQRVDKSGSPNGAPMQISDGTTDDQLNDISAGRIVYTAYESNVSTSGNIMLWDTATGTTTALTPAAVEVGEVRIDGSVVAWVQGAFGSQEIMYLDLTWPEGIAAVSVAGPAPSASQVEVGDAFVVWREGPAGRGDIWALGRSSGATFAVEFDAGQDASNPSTAGVWMSWAQRDIATGATSIQAWNDLTSENRVVANDGSGVFAPAMDGDYVAYESDAAGNFDIYLYRMSDGDNHQVTTGAGDQRLNSIFGDKIAYLDLTSGFDIGLSTFSFVPVDPCAGFGGDADGDGVCQNVDNCPSHANPDQADSDFDGFGDACDNCAAVHNIDQADVDGDGIGDACDNCASASNANQRDIDGDSIGDVCDNCPSAHNASQADTDGDLRGDACDACALDPFNDIDADGWCGNVDNCMFSANPSQSDIDGDGIGDVCDLCTLDEGNDVDGDGWCGNVDNCPSLANAGQADTDGDGIGDVCEAPLPDLIFTQFVVTPPLSTTADPLTLTIIVSNLGDAETPQATTVRLFIDDNPAVELSVPSLRPSPGASFLSEYPLGALTAGPHTVKADIDVLNLIEELSDTNNHGEITFTVTQAPEPDIDLSPAQLNFGTVEIGQTKTQLASIINSGDADLMISDLTLSGSLDYALGAFTTPMRVIPGSFVDLVLHYTPSVVGLVIAVVDIQSNDPDESFLTLQLTGEGILVEVPPQEQIAAITEFMIESQLSGQLVGDGPGQSGSNRFSALVNMIDAAGDLIAANDLTGACDQLSDALLKTDGVKPPPDFVTGVAASELAERIISLSQALSCP